MTYKTENELQEAICYAKEMGYKTAVYKMKWKGYNVYEPIYSEQFACIGLPLMILEKKRKFRMTTSKEAFELLDIMANTEE